MTDKITIERETLQEAVYAMENATMYDDADFAALDALKGALRAALAAQPAPAAVPPCHVAVIGHRFDPVNQIHVPQVLLEFEPVPVNSPNDAKGWQDRDALAAMIAAAGDKT